MNGVSVVPGQSYYESILPLKNIDENTYFEPNLEALKEENKNKYDSVVIITPHLGGAQHLNSQIRNLSTLTILMLFATLVLFFIRKLFVDRIHP